MDTLMTLAGFQPGHLDVFGWLFQLIPLKLCTCGLCPGENHKFEIEFESHLSPSGTIIISSKLMDRNAQELPFLGQISTNSVSLG